MKLHFFLSTNDGTIFIFVIQKSNDIKSQAEESVMLGFNPGISFTDSRAKHGNDRGEETNTATIEEKKNKSGNDKL